MTSVVESFIQFPGKQYTETKNLEVLGIKDLSLMNKAFLAKLAWRFFTTPEALWATILKAKYGILLPPRVVQAGYSQVWKGINTGAKTILKGMEAERNCHHPPRKIL